MRKQPFVFLLASLALFSVSTKAQQSPKGDLRQHSQTPVVLQEEDLIWMDDPMGVKVAALQGNPYEEGMYTVRVIFPAKWKVAPHWHPNMEVVTVLKGSMYVGIGEQFDEKKAVLVEEGGVSAMPAKVAHYAFTKEGCVFQVHGMGPVERVFTTQEEGLKKE